jgi:DNA-binding phage protein
MPKKQLVAEALIDLHRRLSTLATRSHERRIMQETANLYGVSEQSLYRALAQRARPRAVAALRSWYTEGIATRQDGVLLRTHRRPQGSDIE